MTSAEQEAQAAVAARVGPAAFERLAEMTRLVVAENQNQNLISPTTVDQIWTRHVLDSVQLIPLAPDQGTWLDIGTGGGFPGLAVGLVVERPIVLVEPRRRRAEFLAGVAEQLGAAHIRVVQRKVERVEALDASVISARAVASVEKLLRAAEHCATTDTRWLLPRGRVDQAELAALQREWKGVFHVEQSTTDPQSSILILDKVTRR